nr:FxsA family protein [Oceanobacter mangrovi]
MIFIVVPLIELAVLIKVGSYIGVLWTVLIIFLTAVLGVRILKQQGMGVLMRAQQKMNEGALPASELAEGFLLALAGALLLTPGFVTDAVGFALLVPQIRRSMLGNVMKVIKPRVVVGGGFGQRPQADPFQQPRSEQPKQGVHGHRPETIDGEYRRED